MNVARSSYRTHVVILLGAAFAGAAPCMAQDAIPLEQLLTKGEQTKLGVSSMPPEKRDALRSALTRTFKQGYRAAQIADRPSGSTGQSVAETQLDGAFNGWEGETILKLINGQIWRQTEYHYEYHYAYMPKVLVYLSSGGHKMKVDGTSRAIGVQRLR